MITENVDYYFKVDRRACIIRWILISILITGIGVGFYFYYRDIYFEVNKNKCTVSGYSYEVNKLNYDNIIKYRCIPKVLVDYKYHGKIYKNKITMVGDYKKKENGIIYDNFDETEKNDCINKLKGTKDFYIGKDIKHCYVKNKDPSPNCVCRISNKSANDCCHGGNSVLFIIACIFITAILIILVCFILALDSENNRLNCCEKTINSINDVRRIEIEFTRNLPPQSPEPSYCISNIISSNDKTIGYRSKRKYRENSNITDNPIPPRIPNLLSSPRQTPIAIPDSYPTPVVVPDSYPTPVVVPDSYPTPVVVPDSYPTPIAIPDSYPTPIAIPDSYPKFKDIPDATIQSYNMNDDISININNTTITNKIFWDNTCIICSKKHNNVVFPCHHMVLCKTCYNNLEDKKCPLCREKLLNIGELTM